MEATTNVYTGLKKMRAYYHSGITLDYHFRIKQLQKLKEVIMINQEEIYAALEKDLKKSREESYATEIGLVLAEITFSLKKLKKWMRPEKLKTNFLNFPSTSKLYREPYGVSLIISAWNYPFQLLIAPLVGAIAAGNCVVLKPSEVASATSAVIAKMFKGNFDPQYIVVHEGDGSKVIPGLMESFRFDYIFYTGGTTVGKLIYQAAAKDLIPVTLELGGKSPAVVEKEADLKSTARRIVLGKFLNAGQTCVAPDYVLVQNDIKKPFFEELINTTKKFYGNDASQSYDYGKAINERHFDSLVSMLPGKEKIVYGGEYDRDKLYFSPTIVTDIHPGEDVMQREIFGPILPVLSYNKKEDALDLIKGFEKPLSFYLFTKNKESEKWWMKNASFGGGCVNNTLWHLSNPNMPFGGVGDSGMGAYHGKYSFLTFSHSKAVLSTPTWFDPAFKYPPFKGRMGLFKRFIK